MWGAFPYQLAVSLNLSPPNNSSWVRERLVVTRRGRERPLNGKLRDQGDRRLLAVGGRFTERLSAS